MITPKEIKKLADACRKAGVKTFTCPEFSFELGEQPEAVKKTKKQTNAPVELPEKTFESDELTEMDLLMYSAGGYSEIVPKGN